MVVLRMGIKPKIEMARPGASFDTLFALARHRAQADGDRVAYTFLLDGETDELNLTYAELDERARAIAARLQTECRPGDHVLLLFDPGLDYVAALFGCVYAAVIPVPA